MKKLWNCFAGTATCSVALLLGLQAAAQVVETPLGLRQGVELADTLPPKPGPLPEPVVQRPSPEPEGGIRVPPSISPVYVFRYIPELILAPQSRVNPAAVDFEPERGGLLHAWDSGGVSVSGSRENLPGLMGVESGGVGVTQQFGDLTVGATATATKYGYFHGAFTTYGISGMASYRFSPAVSLTVYGSIYSRNPFVSAAMAPYVATDNFGGYFTFNFSEHWGVDVGVAAEQNTATRRYEARPNVTPFYRMGDAKLGVDVGGILYEALRHRQRLLPGNATIGAPIYMGAPEVRPHDSYH